MTQPVLEVIDLATHFVLNKGVVKAVDGVSLSVNAGEVLGVVGESGSGKTITGFSILGLVDPPGQIVHGKVLFKGADLRKLADEDLARVRGDRVSMVFQDPMMTLNPVLRIETQMIEAVMAHEKASKAVARDRAVEALAKVGIPSPRERIKGYPHQFSGGMRQRVAIAIALINNPDLIIADEPTTALDVTIQAQIIHEIQKVAAERGTALIWITHDLSVVAGLADKIAVMYAGRIVEEGSTDDVLDRPRHPYTRGLINSIPSHNEQGGRLRQIPGMAPSLLSPPKGCAFKARCASATSACSVPPEMTAMAPAHFVRCHHPLPVPSPSK